MPDDLNRAHDDYPKVTAILPSYNAAAFIQRTLDCLAVQTWPNLEILIGDDCSTDETPRMIEAFSAGRSNVRILPRKTNLGWLRNTNDLMANAAGEFMFFAFHDDVVAPEYAELLTKELLNNPRAILAFSDLDLVEVDKTSQIRQFEDISGGKSALGRGYLMTGRASGWWVPNRGVFRSRVVQEFGGIAPNEQGEYGADWPWLLRLSLIGEFIRVPKVLCRKYYQEKSLSKTWAQSREQKTALRNAAIKEVRSSPAGPFTKLVLRLSLMRYFPRFRLRLKMRINRARSG